MIKNILIIILLAIGVSCYSQTQTSRVVVSMVDGGDNIVFTHKDSSKTIVPDHSVGVIYRVANSIAINVTVKSEGETDRIIALDYRYILSPTFASTKSLIDTISAWTSSANSSSSYVDTAITRRIDTTNAILSRGDTSNSGLLLSIHNLLVDSLDKNIFIENDSIRVWFNNPLDTSNAGILNAIYNQLVGTPPILDIDGMWVKDEANTIHYMIVTLDNAGTANFLFYDQPNGSPTTPSGKLKPFEKPSVHFKTIILDGNAGGTATAYEAETSTSGEIVGTPGSDYTIEPGFRYFNIVYRAETVMGSEFSINSIDYIADIGEIAVTPLYKRGDPGYQLKIDERYIVHVEPGCYLEITEVR